MDDLDLDELKLILDELHAGLDVLPYHVYLGVAPDCAGDQLRQAFHHRAQRFHPDRFYSHPSAELRARVYAVYKRITEAYRVLGDAELRRAYEEQRRNAPAPVVRLDRAPRRPSGPIRLEETLQPQAKKYYQMALDSERRGDAKGAKLNLQLALQLAPQHPLLLEKMEKYK